MKSEPERVHGLIEQGKKNLTKCICRTMKISSLFKIVVNFSGKKKECVLISCFNAGTKVREKSWELMTIGMKGRNLNNKD